MTCTNICIVCNSFKQKSVVKCPFLCIKRTSWRRMQFASKKASTQKMKRWEFVSIQQSSYIEAKIPKDSMKIISIECCVLINLEIVYKPTFTVYAILRTWWCYGWIIEHLNLNLQNLQMHWFVTVTYVESISKFAWRVNLSTSIWIWLYGEC